MSGKIFKKPSLAKQRFGVDKSGRSGLSSFFNDWGKNSAEVMTEDATVTPIIITSLVAGALLYTGGQLAEYHSSMNDRPDIPEQHLMQIDHTTPISMVSLYGDPDRNVTNILHSDLRARELIVIHNETDGTYEITECTTTRCEALSADDVRELKAELTAMADEHERPYLSGDFFFPHKIEYVTQPLFIQDIENGLFSGDSEFYTTDTAYRHFESDPFNIDGKDRRLSSEHLSLNADSITELWRAALDSPDAGVYEVTYTSGDGEPFVWPRLENEEWQDTIVSENMAYTMMGIFGILSTLAIGGTGINSIGRTRKNVRPLTGFEMLKHKPK
jgi:hypothetical protein